MQAQSDCLDAITPGGTIELVRHMPMFPLMQNSFGGHKIHAVPLVPLALFALVLLGMYPALQ